MSAGMSLMRQPTYQEQVRLVRADALVAACFAAAGRIRSWFSTARPASAADEDAAVDRTWYGAFY